MSSRLEFLKVEGGGNDFVLLDARRGRPPRCSSAEVRGWLDRHRGVGGDGLLLLRSTPDGEIQVRYWNSDGGRAAYCGNGARCVGRVLLDSARGQAIAFRFGSTRLEARRFDALDADRVAVRTPRPRAVAPPSGPASSADGASWFQAGVPHWILPVRSSAALEAVDVARLALPIRHHRRFGPAGTNVTWVAVDRARRGRAPLRLRVRSFERGVEAETLACGSGILAAATWAIARGFGGLPIEVIPTGGDRFRVLASEADARRGSLWLEGPARIVFRGVLP